MLDALSSFLSAILSDRRERRIYCQYTNDVLCGCREHKPKGLILPTRVTSKFADGDKYIVYAVC